MTRFAEVGNYGKSKYKSCIQDSGRVLGADIHETISVTKRLPDFIDDKHLEEYDVEFLKNNFDYVKKYFERYPKVEKCVRILLNRKRVMGHHASGVVILDRDIDECLPVYEREGTKLSVWVEGEEARELNDNGVVKFDVLGSKNLSILSDCIELVNKKYNTSFTPRNIPLEDREALDLIKRGETGFIFQLESGLGQSTAKMLEPNNFFDITILSGLVRPGPIKANIPQEVSDRKSGKVEYTIAEPLKDILKDTYSKCIFQEQQMLICQSVGGMTAKEANKLRKVLVKAKNKKTQEEEIPKYRRIWDSNALSNLREYFESEKKTKEYVDGLWNEMESMAAYSFNRSHSVSYSLLTMREAFLKSHYYPEFMSIALSYEPIENIRSYTSELKGKDISIEYPDINSSSRNFEIDTSGNFLFPLSHIKNITDKVREEIVSKRPYTSLGDFMSKINRRIVDKRKVESLIMSNCFSKIDVSRLELMDLFYRGFVDKGEENSFNEMKESEIVKIEEDLMGFSLSKKSLYDQVKDYVRAYGSSVKFPVELKTNMDIRGDFLLVGTVKDIKEKTSKKGKQYWDVKITDNESDVYMFVWGSRDMKKLSKKGVYIFSVRTFKDSSRISLIETKDNIRVIM